MLKKPTGEVIRLKNYHCRLYYDDPLGVDLHEADRKRVCVFYDVNNEIKNIPISKGDIINIRSDFPSPEELDFLSVGDLYLASFLIELDPL